MKLASLEAIARALNEAAIPFVVVGGLAVVAHGYLRQTQDVDLVTKLDPDTAHAIFRALGSLGYRPIVPVTAEGLGDPVVRAQWVSEKHMTVLSFVSEQHRETPVDLFVVHPFDFEQEYPLTLVNEVVPGVPIHIIRLESLLALKRLAGRPQDLADITELESIGRRAE